jgi:hypothetical protein
MRFTAFAVVFGFACTGRSSHPDAATVASCEADFVPVIDKTCVVAGDCVLLGHTDCCGITELGIAKSSQAAAQAAEVSYDACVAAACGARGCASATKAEDGRVPSATQTIVAVCSSGQCTSIVQ